MSTVLEAGVPPNLPRTSDEWGKYFRRNRERLLPIPWDTSHRLTDAERDAIAHSIRIFQLGESGEGRFFIEAAERDSATGGDFDYVDALKLFIAEEQRHSRDLARFMEQQGIARMHRQWSNNLFRRLRKLMNLELCIAVLVTAEIIAKVYYRALRDATASPALRALCNQILRDEVMHIEFQVGKLRALRRRRPRWLRRLCECAQRVLLDGTLLVVWLDHYRCFRAGGYSFRRYWTQSQRECDGAQQIARR